MYAAVNSKHVLDFSEGIKFALGKYFLRIFKRQACEI